MQCELCGGEVILNVQDFVIREEPTPYKDTTLVSYLAHKACHDQSDALKNTHWSFTWRPQ